MAFQMIPPRLSSSPPPLDSLPSVTCPGVDDDEFDHFSSHNASFDITGLSDKLPPTPETSPSKFPGIRLGPAAERSLSEGVEDSISQDSGVDSSNHPHEFSPQPQGDAQTCREFLSNTDGVKAEKELSDGEQNEEDDFGDFQGVDAVGDKTLSAPDCMVNSLGSVGVDQDDSQISSQPLSQESENDESRSLKDELGHSPPPLDCLAKNIVEEESFFARFSPDDDGDKDDFGDFSSHEAAFQSTDQGNVDTKIKCETQDSQLFTNANKEESDQVEAVPLSTNILQITTTSNRLNIDRDSEKEISTHLQNDIVSEATRSASGEGGETELEGRENSNLPPLHKGLLRAGKKETQVETCTVDPPEVIENHTSTDRTEACVTGALDVSQGGRKNLEKTTVSASDTSVSSDGGPRTQGEVTQCTDSSLLSDTNHSVCPESDGTKQRLGGDAEDQNKWSDDESDFGDFNKADDDDLDFADLREQVENGTFGDDDLGDLNSGQVDSIGGGDAEEDSDDFGDFAAPANTDNEFGDFENFEVHGKECTVKEEEDGFGDFSGHGSSSSGTFTGFSAERVREATLPAPSGDATSGLPLSTSIVLQKLENLVGKWIPKVPGVSHEDSCLAVSSLHQAIESDAFVWRQLENLESSAALTLSWGSTQAHNLFLSSVNVDARNILFGQKWSSSVPLFAQTLSFSPLTPAKSSEGGGGGAASVGLVGSTKECPPATLASAPSKPAHQHREASAEPSAVDGSSEEQIPPAKFDWTSSGLTNPLEGPGLEQEFLSESEEKGSGGWAAKSPPTPSPLVQQILGRGMSKVPSPATPLQSLSPEVRQVVTQLPDLAFMRSRVLMFPIRGEQ